MLNEAVARSPLPDHKCDPCTRRQEVEAAQAGAAAERAARADAEAALAEARASLRHTNEWLQESLTNGPKAALAALLEEKEAAKEAAAKAMEEAVSGTHALRKKRGKESSLLTSERGDVGGRVSVLGRSVTRLTSGSDPPYPKPSCHFDISAV